MAGRGAPRLYSDQVVARGRELWMEGKGDQAIASALNAEFPEHGGRITKPTVQVWRQREQWPPRPAGPFPFELDALRAKLAEALQDIGDLECELAEAQDRIAELTAYIAELENQVGGQSGGTHG